VAETLRLPGSAMVGLFAETPITVRFTWANIDGHIIGFYRPVSLIVNYPMIERWIDDHLAPPKGNCETCRTTAANFGTVIDALGIRLKPTHNED